MVYIVVLRIISVLPNPLRPGGAESGDPRERRRRWRTREREKKIANGEGEKGRSARSRLRFLEGPEGVGSRDIATELINARRERFLRRSPPRLPLSGIKNSSGR